MIHNPNHAEDITRESDEWFLQYFNVRLTFTIKFGHIIDW